MRKKLAIIGSGISGMASAYLLKDLYEITVFEKEGYIGGHTHTIEQKFENDTYKFDTGFMVFNEVTYPLMTRLFKELEAPYHDTDMSFAVRFDPAVIEYNGCSFSDLFTQKKNWFNFNHWKMIYDINRFNNQAIKDKFQKSDLTIGQYIQKHSFGPEFLYRYLIPMSSAVWSTPVKKMLDFPVQGLIDFFYNHGFLGLDTQHQWKTCIGGSDAYKTRIIKGFKDNILFPEGAQEVYEKGNIVIVKTPAGEKEFDQVIIAAHADDALKILKTPNDFQKEVLSAFPYQANDVVVHNDESVMPKIKQNWCSWNYVVKNTSADHSDHYTVYYMNKLQHLGNKDNVFINVNGREYINPDKIKREFKYHHPVFDLNSYEAQKKIYELNHKSKIQFCGAYQRYGFHEDGLWSAVELCRHHLSEIKLGGDIV